MTVERVVAISGGIGGAKLTLGLYRLLPADALTVIVNTGDDFEHLGLHISPDIDTCLYTLSGLAGQEQGWGRADESWNFLAALEALGGETWFRLGDRDLALHVERTRQLAAGQPLSAVVAGFADHLGITAEILPMSEASVRTLVGTDEGLLAFQDYFVRRRCAPRVASICFDMAPTAAIPSLARERLSASDTAAIILCPSNPYLSIDPILAVPGFREALADAIAPVIAVSPIVAGAAFKGPTAKIMQELGLEVSARTVATHYAGLIDAFLLDESDATLAPLLDVPTRLADTRMTSLDDRIRVARTALDWARELR